MSTPETLRWWGDQFRTRTSEFYTSHVLVADLNYAADEIEKLQAENAKLRELVHELWDGYADPPCDDCPLKDNPACVDCPICAREAEVIDRMRELVV